MKRISYLLTYLIMAISLGTQASAQAHPMQACHDGEPWSDAYGSNAGTSAVAAGDFVHIVYGQTVVLDETTVDLGGLWLEGTVPCNEMWSW